MNAEPQRSAPWFESRAARTTLLPWTIGLLLVGIAFSYAPTTASGAEAKVQWNVGVAQSKITPEKLMWMGGFAARTRPAEGTTDDLWVKVLALEAADGGRAVLVALDLVGVPKWLYDNLSRELEARHGLSRAQVRFAASHTHTGPVLREALTDIYPLDDAQRRLIAEYSGWLEPVILETVARALDSRKPATLWAGEGRATIAVNRRTNDESKLVALLAAGGTPNGPSDYAVPVLAVRNLDGTLRTVVFGYAAHTSALTLHYRWSADYSGVCVREIEESHPGIVAMFFQGCGSDQSCAPRGSVELCRARGLDLAKSVREALTGTLREVRGQLRTAHEFVSLDFGEQPSRDELKSVAAGTDYRARWAKRLLGELDAGRVFASRYPEYPVQVWRLGDRQLWIALGGEVCVDYALRFKREYGDSTWVNGYANDVMAYIPSHRLWKEGGYQAGAFEVYGLPANRWCEDIEDRLAGAVARLVERVKGAKQP